MKKATQKSIPPYIRDIYSWLYLNQRLYNFLNSTKVQNILTLGQHSHLINELNKEITSKSTILQIGVTLGDQIAQTSHSLSRQGEYTIMDILPNILEKCQEKHARHRINYIKADASKPFKEIGEYDTVICYMLLHELPPITRQKVINNVLKTLPIGGKAVFIDYHLPSSLNPLKYIIRAVNRLYQPFAEALWKTAIKEMTTNKEKYTWSKQTYFGGIYQKVVATRES